jgi:lysophospholipase L1-like esterase
VLEGVNDLGSLDLEMEHSQAEHDKLVAALEEALRQMAIKAHEHGLRVLAATITPYVGSAYYHPGPRAEADRQKLNQWIGSSDAFDGVIDFDALLRDPAHPERLLQEADSGDHLHPGPEGYRRMGEAVPITLLRP